MDTTRILTDLRAERDRINQAIAALEALNSSSSPVTRSVQPTSEPAPERGGKRTMSPAVRKRQSEKMKKSWAARKAAQSQASAKQTTPKPTAAKRGGISAAGRKRISEMMKKRWAARKKAAAKAA